MTTALIVLAVVAAVLAPFGWAALHPLKPGQCRDNLWDEGR